MLVLVSLLVLVFSSSFMARSPLSMRWVFLLDTFESLCAWSSRQQDCPMLAYCTVLCVGQMRWKVVLSSCLGLRWKVVLLSSCLGLRWKVVLLSSCLGLRWKVVLLSSCCFLYCTSLRVIYFTKSKSKSKSYFSTYFYFYFWTYFSQNKS